MTRENLDYLRTVTMDDIPWHSLTGPYERGDAFPGWIKELGSADPAAAEKAVKQIAMHFEHQGTLWHVTPFAVIFLRQALDRAISQFTQRETAKQEIINILCLYHLLYQAAEGMVEIEPFEPLPSIQDLILPENLPPETAVDEDEDDEEEGMLEEFYAELDEKLFGSFFIYTWLTLAYSMEEDFPRLRELGDEELREGLEAFSSPETDAFLRSFL